MRTRDVKNHALRIVQQKQTVLRRPGKIHHDPRAIGPGPQPNGANIDRLRGLQQENCQQQSANALTEQSIHGNKLTLNLLLFQVKLDT
jgi:hypothetical protein